MAKGMILRRGGAVSGLPEFTYSGTYSLLDDGDGNWRIKFLTSGTLRMSDAVTIDVFALGGGGAGASYNGDYYGCGGGAGGYTATYSSIVLQAGTDYTVVVGAGGTHVSQSAGNAGGKSYFDSSVLYFANGGNGGSSYNGGSGGTGGGSGCTAETQYAGNGGTDGGNSNRGGTGQGTTTREFGEATGALYSGGGGGAEYRTGSSAHRGTGGAPGGGNGASGYAVAQTGGGGGGARNRENAGDGAAGIVIIRNHRA